MILKNNDLCGNCKYRDVPMGQAPCEKCVMEIGRPSYSPRENINHPSHYNMGSIEVIDVIEDWNLGFSLGNAVKYIGRAGHKGDALEDLKKAKWYLEREIERREKNA